jgi:hypothetical protein
MIVPIAASGKPQTTEHRKESLLRTTLLWEARDTKVEHEGRNATQIQRCLTRCTPGN